MIRSALALLSLLLVAALAGPAQAAGKVFIVGGEVHVGDGTVLADHTVEISGGKIVRVGKAGAKPGPSDTAIDAKGKIVTPGFIAAGTQLGLTEIDMEDASKDKEPKTEDPIRAAYDASTAVNAGSSLIQVQAVEGITTAAVTPTGGLISGQVAWIDLLAGDHRTIVASRGVAMQAHLGQSFAGSRAATHARLREVLDDARFVRARRAAYDRRQTRDVAAHRLDLEALAPVLDGSRPLVLTAHRASDILTALDLARDLKLDIVIVGASQGWQVADQLAKAKVPVIVQPSQNLPRSMDAIGARLDNAALLHAAGVDVAIGVLGDAHNARNVKQEVGIAIAHGLPRNAAVKAVTLNVARAYGMEADYGTLAAGNVASVVVWDGDPFELSTWPSAVIVRGRAVRLRSRQTELRERYKDLSRFRRSRR